MSRLGKMDTKRGRGCFLGSDNLGWSSNFISFFLWDLWSIQYESSFFFGGGMRYTLFSDELNLRDQFGSLGASFLVLGKIFSDGWVGELKIYHDISNTGWSIWVNLPCNLQHGGMNIGSLFDDLGHMFIHVYPFFGSCADEGSMASVEQGFGFRATWWSRYQA